MKKRVFISLFIFVVLIYLLWIFNRLSDRSSFCASCHFMEPFVDNWQTSSHNTVSCKECHWAPEFSDYIGGKARLFSEILKYFAGAYNVQVHSKVKDEACLECHDEETIVDSVGFKRKIYFSHQVHYADSLRDIKMPCTGCHYELVQGNHMAVTEDPCFICHFVGRPAGRPVEDCYTCHGPPKDALFIDGIVFNHKEYLEIGVSCLTCHVHVTRGMGDVSRKSCYKCHIERFEAFGEVKKIHSIHITEEKFKCTECHNILEHSRIEMAQAISPDCKSCHRVGHSIQEKVYMGIGTEEIASSPDPMFISNVACFGCHSTAESRFGEELLPFIKATGQSCNDCHGKGYDKLLEMWQNSVGNKLSLLKKKISFLKPIVEKSRDKNAYKYLDSALEYTETVEKDGSLGAHNIKYSIALLNYAERKLENSERILLGWKTKRYDITTKSQQDCESCHPDAIEYDVIVGEREFPHREHISNFKCGDCHSIKKHGKTLKKNCESCHHRETQNCEGCHSIQSLVYKGKLGGIDSSEPMYEAGVSCADCHLVDEVLRRPNPEGCLQCHEEGYDEIMVEWQETSKSRMKKFENYLQGYKRWLSGEVGNNLKKSLVVYVKASFILDSLKKDGSKGVHNYGVYDELISKWERDIK